MIAILNRTLVSENGQWQLRPGLCRRRKCKVLLAMEVSW
jgi:hypothetical protein